MISATDSKGLILRTIRIQKHKYSEELHTLLAPD